MNAWSQTFFQFQAEWLFESATNAICNKSRQTGYSHTTAAVAALWAAFLGETTTIISIGQREAEEVLYKAALHAKALAQLGSRWAIAAPRGEALEFASGGRIWALPSSSGGRGFSGNMFLDEFAYVPNPKEVWDGAAAVTMHGYRMRVVSTPNGVGNEFYNLWNNPTANKGWAKHETPIAKARAQGLVVSDEKLWSMAKGDPRLYAQLFECAFLDGNEQYLPTEIVNRAVVAEFDPRLVGRRYAGLDVGLVNDLTVLAIGEQDDRGVVHLVDVEECKRTDWEAQQMMVERSAAYWGWERLCVDATGLGAVPCELLQKKLGKMRVEAVSFTSQSKEALATLLYQALNDNMVKMLRDTAVIRDLCSIRRTITTTGAVRYDAPRTDEGHADRAWALALMLQACAKRPTRAAALAGGDFVAA